MRYFSKIYWILAAQLGLDPLKGIRSLKGIFRYLSDYLKFRERFRGELNFLPCLNDWHEEGGLVNNEYFWQDLEVARKIYSANPIRHVDIGSRIDGFVAHVASFRDIEVFDIRPVSVKIPGILFRQADLMNPSLDYINYCDSISCLHALEHFGLGRYGDTINVKGYELGIQNLAIFLKKYGILYLSVPVGRERVEFNANWIFNPLTIIKIASSSKLELKEFLLYTHINQPEIKEINKNSMTELGDLHYGLGLFVFIKM